MAGRKLECSPGFGRDPGMTAQKRSARTGAELRVQRSGADKEPPPHPPRTPSHPSLCLRPILQAPAHLRGEFPGPEEAPGPQLLELHCPAQVAFDLGQLQVGLGVQPLGVGQQLVVDDLLLRDEASRVWTGAPARLQGVPAARPFGRLHETRTPPPTPSHPNPPRPPPLSGLRLLRVVVALGPIPGPPPLAGALLAPRGSRFVGGCSGRSARPAPARLVTLQPPGPEVPDEPQVTSGAGRGGATTSEETATATATVGAAPSCCGPGRSPHPQVPRVELEAVPPETRGRIPSYCPSSRGGRALPASALGSVWSPWPRTRRST